MFFPSHFLPWFPPFTTFVLFLFLIFFSKMSRQSLFERSSLLRAFDADPPFDSPPFFYVYVPRSLPLLLFVSFSFLEFPFLLVTSFFFFETQAKCALPDVEKQQFSTPLLVSSFSFVSLPFPSLWFLFLKRFFFPPRWTVRIQNPTFSILSVRDFVFLFQFATFNSFTFS